MVMVFKIMDKLSANIHIDWRLSFTRALPLALLLRISGRATSRRQTHNAKRTSSTVGGSYTPRRAATSTLIYFFVVAFALLHCAGTSAAIGQTDHQIAVDWKLRTLRWLTSSPRARKIKSDALPGRPADPRTGRPTQVTPNEHAASDQQLDFLWEWCCGSSGTRAPAKNQPISKADFAIGRNTTTANHNYIRRSYRQDVFAVTLKNFRGCTVNYFEQLIAVLDALLERLGINPWEAREEPRTFLLPSTPYGWGGAILASPNRIRFVTNTALPLCFDAATEGGSLDVAATGNGAGEGEAKGHEDDDSNSTGDVEYRTYVDAGFVNRPFDEPLSPELKKQTAWGPRDSDELWKNVKIEKQQLGPLRKSRSPAALQKRILGLVIDLDDMRRTNGRPLLPRLEQLQERLKYFHIPDLARETRGFDQCYLPRVCPERTDTHHRILLRQQRPLPTEERPWSVEEFLNSVSAASKGKVGGNGGDKKVAVVAASDLAFARKNSPPDGQKKTTKELREDSSDASSALVQRQVEQQELAALNAITAWHEPLAGNSAVAHGLSDYLPLAQVTFVRTEGDGESTTTLASVSRAVDWEKAEAHFRDCTEFMASDFYEADIAYDEWPELFQQLARVVLKANAKKSNTAADADAGDEGVLTEVQRWRVVFLGCAPVMADPEFEQPIRYILPLTLAGLLRGFVGVPASTPSSAQLRRDDVMETLPSYIASAGPPQHIRPSSVNVVYASATVGDAVKAYFAKFLTTNRLRANALRQREERLAMKSVAAGPRENIINVAEEAAAPPALGKNVGLQLTQSFGFLSPDPLPWALGSCEFLRQATVGGREAVLTNAFAVPEVTASILAGKSMEKKGGKSENDYSSMLPLRCKSRPPTPAERAALVAQTDLRTVQEAEPLQVAVCITGRARTLLEPSVYESIHLNGTTFPRANVSYFYVLDLQGKAKEDFAPAFSLMPPTELRVTDATGDELPEPSVLAQRRRDLEVLREGGSGKDGDERTSYTAAGALLTGTESTARASQEERTSSQLRISTIHAHDPPLEKRQLCDAPNSSAYQSQKLNVCMDLVRGFEAKQTQKQGGPFRFDWVVRTRPDLRFFSPVGDLRRYDTNAAHLIVRNVTTSRGDTQDHFALLPRKTQSGRSTDIAEAYMDYDGCSGVTASKVQRACAKTARVTWTETARVTHECAFNIRLRDRGVRVKPIGHIYAVTRCGDHGCFDSETNPLGEKAGLRSKQLP